MAVKGILFNTEMVHAILDGRKTVTRRAVKPKYRGNECGWRINRRAVDNVITGLGYTDEDGCGTGRYINPPYQIGDILYVRETWREYNGKYYYKADEPPEYDDYFTKKLPSAPKWHPSIHMPKKAARIWLRVTDVRVERLQDMTEKDAEKEGVDIDEWLELCEEAGIVGLPRWPLREFFGYHVWDMMLNGEENMNRYNWNANPWVWVIEFERTVKPDENNG